MPDSMLDLGLRAKLPQWLFFDRGVAPVRDVTIAAQTNDDPQLPEPEREDAIKKICFKHDIEVVFEG